ncbi:unnamed protein product [Effrenium voratum]|nr:unnamed protein product [Effrenium voratum]
MIPASDGLSETSRAIFRRSPLHLSHGWSDLPKEAATSSEHRADINRAVLLIKGHVPSRSSADLHAAREWQDLRFPTSNFTHSAEPRAGALRHRPSNCTTLPKRASFAVSVRKKWGFEQVPSLLPDPLERDTGMLGRSCAGQPPSLPPSKLNFATSFCWPGGDSRHSRGHPRFSEWSDTKPAGGKVRGSDGRFLGF